ncbi:nineteen complex-related protein 2-domain-containing protein [Colletotrichum navitas]|uniref:Nineteen complex-related protein 2-domain-containing protein n=1 Tax=Colletotrichum navitas TaxID=681940 RepID=A0AAD8PLT4_9PEZI|nr:nineteen complex-related protein 2-domain-containing protein [Colletotrichum navitas]KAK1569767.1 nineteen complex-related protein 2-domain-containing protein [Colletotrichum navitas]
MSAFTPKRKAKVIKVLDDDEYDTGKSSPTGQEPVNNDAAPVAVKFTRKPIRQSGLRKSINFNEPDDSNGGVAIGDSAKPKAVPAQDDDEDDGPVVIRPAVSRSSSLKQKKRKSSSRLSFGGADVGDGDDVPMTEYTTPKKSTLGYQALENSALKNRLPMRTFRDEDEDRPRYSKEYLSELQNSTPNTPQSLTSLRMQDEDGMVLDDSELEGALIVNEGDFASRPHQTNILTEAEIQERKQRRARLAHEQQDGDFISFDDEDVGGTSLRKKKNDTRLVREDEDLGEGFDDFVEDGGLSLGRKAEREEKVRRRREMAEQIQMAEGGSDDESDASEAERRAAFEAAQTRSGMDGLQKPERNPAEQLLQVPPKITPLPSLTDCLSRLQTTMRAMELDLTEKKRRVEALRQEKDGIMTRKDEVQQLLNEAGQKYTAALGNGVSAESTTQSTARQITNAGTSELKAERGLESLGTTPNERPDVGELG